MPQIYLNLTPTIMNIENITAYHVIAMQIIIILLFTGKQLINKLKSFLMELIEDWKA